MNLRITAAIITITTISGCVSAETDKTPRYTPPEASGLKGLRPYPTGNDVCERIGENALTNPYLDDSALLIGCPAHETGAIEDRLAEGGEALQQIGDWVLISIPQR
ncbi:hypothetical protein [Halocynthiibacter sp.]|uniref:hypothetical protein n=1 Tax=Halocynthiibacter sp. TaxID=1979210 RepID=UPI003C46A6A3